MSARTRRRLARASFGPEWTPGRGYLYDLIESRHRTPRERERWLARRRAARRYLVAMWDRRAARDAR